ncbi:MAG: hypothetical protein ACK5O8_16820 [Pirellula sp.]
MRIKLDSWLVVNTVPAIVLSCALQAFGQSPIAYDKSSRQTVGPTSPASTAVGKDDAVRMDMRPTTMLPPRTIGAKTPSTSAQVQKAPASTSSPAAPTPVKPMAIGPISSGPAKPITGPLPARSPQSPRTNMPTMLPPSNRMQVTVGGATRTIPTSGSTQIPNLLPPGTPDNSGNVTTAAEPTLTAENPADGSPIPERELKQPEAPQFDKPNSGSNASTKELPGQQNPTDLGVPKTYELPKGIQGVEELLGGGASSRKSSAYGETRSQDPSMPRPQFPVSIQGLPGGESAGPSSDANYVTPTFGDGTANPQPPPRADDIPKDLDETKFPDYPAINQKNFPQFPVQSEFQSDGTARSSSLLNALLPSDQLQRTIEDASGRRDSISSLPEPNRGSVPKQLSGNPWWYDFTKQPLLVRDQPQTAYFVDLDQLIGLSLQFSPKVQAILSVPKIARSEIGIAQAELDPRGFAQSRFHNNSDPVGNTLTTGGPPRLEDTGWESFAGVRDKMATGGRVEWSQALNTRNSNSLFFQPTQQAEAKYTLNFIQPMARGSGVYYNTAAIRIAGLRTNATLGSANRQLQEHAMDIIREYYELLLNRCLLSQSLNGQNRLYQIHEKLRSRVDIDLDKSQLSRSLAAIAKLQEQIATLRGNIRSNQARLRELVNSPLIKSPDCRELIPTTMPISMLVEVDLESEMIGALQLRGDVVEIQNRIEVARVERNIAKNDLRPQLDAIAETYVRGLQGNYDVGRAWTSQLDTGRPSYFAGAVYQSPYGNRAAKSQLQGRTAELARLIYDYEETLNAARAELESATYDSESLFEATDAAIQSTFATQDEVEHQMATFLSNFDGRKSVTSILSDLLDAEQRLIQAENNWVTKHILYMKALSQIKYESGTLLSIIAE